MINSDPPHSDTRVEEDALVTEPLPDRIDPDNFTPRLLALLSNALVWRESHELRRRFNLGTNDWRVISALALRPGSAATDVSDFIGVNKAVVSKSVNVLTARGLIFLMEGPRGSRPMYLTSAGSLMHSDMLPISLSNQDLIHEELDDDQINILNGYLRRMISRVRQVQSSDGLPSATTLGDSTP